MCSCAGSSLMLRLALIAVKWRLLSVVILSTVIRLTSSQRPLWLQSMDSRAQALGVTAALSPRCSTA